MELTDIVSWRVNFLQNKKKYRENSRNIVYIDKTFLNSSHHVPKSWHFDNVSMNIPIIKGEKFIILIIINSDIICCCLKFIICINITINVVISMMNVILYILSKPALCYTVPNPPTSPHRGPYCLFVGLIGYLRSIVFMKFVNEYYCKQ